MKAAGDLCKKVEQNRAAATRGRGARKLLLGENFSGGDDVLALGAEGRVGQYAG